MCALGNGHGGGGGGDGDNAFCTLFESESPPKYNIGTGNQNGYL